MKLVSREQELQDLSSEIQVRSDILSTLREQEAELVQSKQTKEVELRLINADIRKANKSLARKIQEDIDYANPITEKANTLLRESEKSFVDRLQAIKTLEESTKQNNIQSNNLLKEAEKKTKLNELKEENLNIREQAIIEAEQRLLLGKVEIASVQNKKEEVLLLIQHNERLIEQNENILKDNQSTLEDIRKERLNLLAIKGSVQSLARLYANR